MFDKNKFAQIIKNIKETYNSQEDFAKKSGIGRTYLSQYMNMKLDDPPKPKILEKLSLASHGITNYNELMNVCGYTDSDSIYKSFLENNLEKLKEFYSNKLYEIALTKDEEEAYYDLLHIIPEKVYFNLSSNETKKILLDFINNIDFLSKFSKEKILKKTTLFVESIREETKIRKKIIELESKNNNIDYNTFYNLTSSNNFYMCPVYGRISAGQPNWAEECLEGYLPIDPELMGIINPEEYYFLKVNGESMNKIIKNGAFALIHKQEAVKNGEIAVILVNGDEATLKKFSKQGNLVILEPMSDDTSYTTQVYTEKTNIKIIGKYIGKFEINK